VQTGRTRLFWNSDILEALAHDHITGRRNYVHEIGAILTLDAVDRLLFRELPSEPEQTVPAISDAVPAPIS
jgi:hypothetical protein